MGTKPHISLTTKAFFVGRFCMLILLFSCSTALLFAQEEAPIDTSKTNLIKILHSEVLEYEFIDGEAEKRLSGDVELQQDDALMYCDSAVIIGNEMEAYDDVIIEQGNAKMFSDILLYNGDTKRSVLIGNVILTDPPNEIVTDRLDYNLETKVAHYTTGATLSNDKTKLTSERGYYNTETKVAFFKNKVHVEDQNFILDADTLRYDANTKITYFLGPTKIKTKENTIYCESGYYDTEKNYAEFIQNAWIEKEGSERAQADHIIYDGKTDKAELLGKTVVNRDQQSIYSDNAYFDASNNTSIFTDNVQVVDGEKVIFSDSLTYNSETGIGVAIGDVAVLDPPQVIYADRLDYNKKSQEAIVTGNVLLIDTLKEITIECDEAVYNDSTSFIQAIGRPLLTTMIDGDTLYISADTLTSFKEDPDSEDNSFTAINDVRMFKSDLQAVCELLTYNPADSIFKFYDDPILWSDTTQFTADTILVFLKDNKVNKVDLLENALIVNTPDNQFYNQIKGKNIYAYFKKREIYKMDVQGNGEVIYYVRDDYNAYVGVNEVVCGYMLVFFGANQVEKINFYAQPKATVHPMGQVNHSKLKLEGYRWEVKKRPLGPWMLRY